MGTVAQEIFDEGRAKGIELATKLGIEQRIQKAIEQGIEKGIEQGFKLGMEEGIERGKAVMMLRLMTLKFGAVSGPDRDRIGSATPDELDAWSGAILEVGSPDAVFAADRPK